MVNFYYVLQWGKSGARNGPTSTKSLVREIWATCHLREFLHCTHHTTPAQLDSCGLCVADRRGQAPTDHLESIALRNMLVRNCRKGSKRAAVLYWNVRVRPTPDMLASPHVSATSISSLVYCHTDLRRPRRTQICACCPICFDASSAKALCGYATPTGRPIVLRRSTPCQAPMYAIRLHDRKLYTKLFINPELYAAEAYMDGTLTLEDGAAIHDFLLLFSVNRAGLYSYGSQRLMRRVRRGLRRWQQANPIGLAAAHARHHYDISTELYRLFLDDQMQYSCAYFRDPEHETLEQAQRNKLIHATSKLQLKPGMTVAEIGSGWGGFAIHLARETGAHVTAINVSPEQIKVARVHAEAAGVSDRIAFRELDYRQLTGQFDRVVSVGMMEQRRRRTCFNEYFLKIRELLTPYGFALINSIVRMSKPGTNGPFIRKYIYPGG